MSQNAEKLPTEARLELRIWETHTSEPFGCTTWPSGITLWAMGYGLWAMGYGLWAMGYGIWDMGYGDIVIRSI